MRGEWPNPGVLNMDWIENQNQNEKPLSEIHSFYDYFEIFNENFLRECRPTYEYLLNMIDYFGVDEKGHYKLFQIERSNDPAVFGQLKTQKAFVQNLKNFQEEGFNNKFLLLVGPNGSAKSSLIRKFMKGAEEYSEKNEGALYSFSWIFPIDNYVKGTLGLTGVNSTKELSTFAYLEDKEIAAILNSELKDHPLLLIPIEHRQILIEKNFADSPERLNSMKKSYLYNGDLSKRNRMIYDALLKNYKGRHNEVLKHIRIERFTISKRYSSGAATIEPQLHVDARIQQITMDKRLGSLPPSLQSLNLFSLQGEAILANRGILEYSDLLKRPIDTYKYLLMTMETGTINLNGILTELDIFFIGTSNEIHLAAFKQHPDFNSFKGRFNFIKVPYLLDFTQEKKIYQAQVDGLKERVTFEPHSLRALCQFAVMTRLRSCMGKHYQEDSKLASIVTTLNPLEKCYLYSTGELPDRLDVEAKQILKHSIQAISDEFENENLYEGKFGISPRDIKNIIYKLSSMHEHITFVEILEFLEKLTHEKNDFDFLNMTPHGDFHNPSRYIALIREKMLVEFDRELRESLGMVDDRSYEDYLRKYIENVNALLKGEKIKNAITGKYEECDDYFIKEFEHNIELKEDANKFRTHLISKLGAYYLDNPDKEFTYKLVFPDIVNRLQESFRNEQKKAIVTISKNLVFYESESKPSAAEKQGSTDTRLSEENRIFIQNAIENLKIRHGYSHKAALGLIKYLLNERY